MAVPERWWPGYSSAKLCYGKIASINKTAARDLNVFTLVLKDEPRKRYGMRYDAVVLYADEHDEKTCEFHLPSDPPADPARDRSVAVACPSRTPVRRRMVRLPPDLPPLLPHVAEPDGYDYDDDSEADDDPKVEDVEEAEEEDEDPWLVRYTDPDKWILVTEDELGNTELPVILPIAYEPREGEGEDFDVKISDEELASLKDKNGHIRYEKVVEFLLPDFEGEGYFEWIGARVRSYMTYLIRLGGYTSRYYKPEVDKVVLRSHVAHFFGCRLPKCSVVILQ
jgi:hypothetical protein